MRSSESYTYVYPEATGVKAVYLQEVPDPNRCVVTAQQNPRSGAGSPGAASATTAHWDGWITVYTYNAAGAPVNADFSLIVACGQSAR